MTEFADAHCSPPVSERLTGLPAQVEFTASNGLKVATDVRGSVGVQWGSPRTGGWTFHDPDETSALQEFFTRHAPRPTVELPSDPEDRIRHLAAEYGDGLRIEGFASELSASDLDALITQLIAFRTALDAS